MDVFCTVGCFLRSPVEMTTIIRHGRIGFEIYGKNRFSGQTTLSKASERTKVS